MTDCSELVKKLRDLHRDPRPASAEWLFENQVALYDAAAAIESLQAQLPKQGEWIDGDARRVTARCSVCGRLRLGNGAEWANKHVHFCEVCGSRMGDEKA